MSTAVPPIRQPLEAKQAQHEWTRPALLTPSGHRRCIAAFEKMSRHDATGPLFDPIVGSALF
jgi:hypothetical protein